MNKTNLILIIFLILAGVFVFFLSKYDKNLNTSNVKTTSDKIYTEKEQNKIVLNGITRNATIYDISEYDFKTKQEIYNLRKYVVAQTMSDFVKDYKINENVYGAIEDNKPWWGMQGIMCRGSGKNSIDGPSEESRFMNNPLILLGLDMNVAINLPNWDCSNVYPKPSEIMIKPDLNQIIVTYNITNYNEKIANTPWASMQDIYHFAAQNARDFGYEYGFVSDYSGIKFTNNPNISTHVYKFLDYIHTGGSCGYDGGCNNGSPTQPNLHFNITSLPANVEFKLYRHNPKSTDDTPDLLFRLIFE